MSNLIINPPWVSKAAQYRNLSVYYENYELGALEYNYQISEIDQDSNVDVAGAETAYGLTVENQMYPKNGATNYFAKIDQAWKHSDLQLKEVAYEPVGDNETSYSPSLEFTSSPSGVGAGVGVDVEAPYIGRHDWSRPDTRTQHAWYFPGDNARCSNVHLGDVSTAIGDYHYGHHGSYCPIRIGATFDLRGLTRSHKSTFDPQFLP